MYTGRVLRSVDKVVRQRINIGATEVLKMEAAERIFTEFPGERVYLLFDILLAHSGTVQVFEHKVYVGPTAPKMEVQTSSSHLGLGEEAKVTVQFANPLPFKMEAVSLNVENDGLLHGNPWLLHLFIIICLLYGTVSSKLPFWVVFQVFKFFDFLSLCILNWAIQHNAILNLLLAIHASRSSSHLREGVMFTCSCT